MYVKFFYWMRLFKDYSAFIKMIGEIIWEVRTFFVMMFLCLAAYANVMFVLNLNRTSDCFIDDGEVCDLIYEENFGFGPVDAIVHAYLTGLGDFRTDSYEHADGGETWFMFLVATVVVQLIFMNVLIAIMGESFGKVNGIIDQAKLHQLCVLMEAHIWICNIESLNLDKKYIL